MKEQGGTLMLHAGGWSATEADIAAVPVPERTRTYSPVPHANILVAIREQLSHMGLTETRLQLGLANAGKRLFGVMDLVNGKAADDWGLALGFRSSYDKSMSLKGAAGSRVFICDNLALSGDMVTDERHVNDLAERLPILVGEMLEGCVKKRELLAVLIERMKNDVLGTSVVPGILIEAARRGVMASERIMPILKEYEEPLHPVFAPRTAWSLFNAFTEVAKSASPNGQFVGTQRLTQLFESRY